MHQDISRPVYNRRVLSVLIFFVLVVFSLASDLKLDPFNLISHCNENRQLNSVGALRLHESKRYVDYCGWSFVILVTKSGVLYSGRFMVHRFMLFVESFGMCFYSFVFCGAMFLMCVFLFILKTKRMDC